MTKITEDMIGKFCFFWDKNRDDGRFGYLTHIDAEDEDMPYNCSNQRDYEHCEPEENMTLREKMLALCKSEGFEPTENFDKIVKAKERFGIGLSCPCDRDNKNRYCISALCRSDVLENGTCHCHCYKKVEK